MSKFKKFLFPKYCKICSKKLESHKGLHYIEYRCDNCIYNKYNRYFVKIKSKNLKIEVFSITLEHENDYRSLLLENNTIRVFVYKNNMWKEEIRFPSNIIEININDSKEKLNEKINRILKLKEFS